MRSPDPCTSLFKSDSNSTLSSSIGDPNLTYTELNEPINDNDNDDNDDSEIVNILNNSPINTDKICKYCLSSDEDDENNFISPCKCDGTSKYVHKECLSEWMDKSNNPLSKVKCSECNHIYQYKKINQYDFKKKAFR